MSYCLHFIERIQIYQWLVQDHKAGVTLQQFKLRSLWHQIHTLSNKSHCFSVMNEKVPRELCFVERIQTTELPLYWFTGIWLRKRKYNLPLFLPPHNHPTSSEINDSFYTSPTFGCGNSCCFFKNNFKKHFPFGNKHRLHNLKGSIAFKCLWLSAKKTYKISRPKILMLPFWCYISVGLIFS